MNAQRSLFSYVIELSSPYTQLVRNQTTSYMKDTQIETKNKWRATVAQVPKVEHRTSMSQLLWLFLFMLFFFINEMTHNPLMQCRKK